jgi:hypothetical protein
MRWMRLALLVDPSIDILQHVLKPGRDWRQVTVDQQIKVARDILDRTGHKSKDEILLTQVFEFDSNKFSNLSDAELETLVALARKASTQREV